ncbi:MAG: hypothetical protein SPF37_01950 [Eubacteriales bacterium]|nr:hypothetical protein [Eubacteriales bacterium]
MEYNDNIISSPDEFALLAKEYNEKLKRSKLESKSLFEKLYLLNWVYGYIAIRIRNMRIRNEFKALEKEVSQNIALLLSELETEFSETNIALPKRPNNLRFCLKFAIQKETEFLEELVSFLDEDSPVLREIAFSHLNNIFKLSNYF